MYSLLFWSLVLLSPCSSWDSKYVLIYLNHSSCTLGWGSTPWILVLCSCLGLQQWLLHERAADHLFYWVSLSRLLVISWVVCHCCILQFFHVGSYFFLGVLQKQNLTCFFFWFSFVASWYWRFPLRYFGGSFWVVLCSWPRDSMILSPIMWH